MADRTHPWLRGSATGLGPFPGTDPLAAARVVFDELPQLPFLPELPARGPGSDAIGRTAALFVDLFVDLRPSGWRFVPHPGVDLARARVALVSDLDALEEVAEGYDGALKIQVVGPWTMAGSVELHRGEKALADEGAVRDLVESLAEGVSAHVADVRRRLPLVGDLVVQVDEPLLPTVLAGDVPTQSGWGRLRVVEEPVAEEALRRLLTAAGPAAGVRTGATPPPVALLRRAGARFVSVDAALLASMPDDDLGEALESGIGLLVAAMPLGRPTHPRVAAQPLRRLWQRLGLNLEELARAVAVTPDDGLEQLSPEAAGSALRQTAELARFLEEKAMEES